MIGILVQLAISWLLIWLYNRSNLSVLGLMPSQRRLEHFLLFFAVSALFSASGFWLRMWIGHQQWQVNPEASGSLIAAGTWFNVKSVLYEELIFRGVLFYILIDRLGAKWAIVLSASAFGVYHWFTQGSLGNPTAMIYTFLITGAMGAVLAFGFWKTRSLYVPVAIHLAWNGVQQVIFSNGPLGNQWLVEVLPRPEMDVSYVVFLFVLFFPLMGVLAACTAMIWRIE